MKRTPIMAALLTFGIALAGCGGKSDTTEAEKSKTPAAANTAAANFNTNTAQPGRDTDDRMAVTNSVSNTANTNAARRPDGDRDDTRGRNANSNGKALRSDADDDKDRDSDRDADDR